jgi:hypothetical protein
LYGRPLAAVPSHPPYVASDAVTAAPNGGAVWIPGYYDWNGLQYVWIAGYWAVPPVGFRVFVPGGWIFRGGGYYYRRPYWR